MFWLILLALLCQQEVYAIPAPRPATGLKVAKADHVLNLKRVGAKSPSSKALLLDLATDIEPLKSVEGGGAYGLEVGLSGETYDVVLDTGSSDLWVFHEGVQCINSAGSIVPDSKCDFGPEFPGTFEEGTIADQHFRASYASGEVLIGVLGYEKVTVGDLTVDKQEIGLVDEAYWISGDGEVSGIFGFARSALTSAFPGANPAKDTTSNNIHYPSFIDHAIDQNKIDPVFSVVLERGKNGGSGQLALGGLPTIDFDQNFATVPIEKIEISPMPIEKTKFSYYTIIADGLVIGGESSSTSFPAVVDTGTTLAFLPNDLAEEINNAFDPPSKFIESLGGFENYCDATPPKFAFTIGGKDFYISPNELLLADGYDPATGGCLTGIQPSGMDSAVLGEVFLKNVVAVFDIGNEEIKFAAHENY